MYRGSKASVHPHVRGADTIEYVYEVNVRRFIPTCVGLMGSGSTGVACGNRFIPTCVGLMNRSTIWATSATVHPHVRGADANRMQVREALMRFIPTCVGLMSSTVEKLKNMSGSSPRAWG